MNSTDPTAPPIYQFRKRRKRTEFERHLVFAKTGGRCFYCFDELDFIWDFVCDHFIPLCKGGNDDHSNLVPACYFCDNRKGYCLPTPEVCAWLKKWKHEGLHKVSPLIDLPLPVGKKTAKGLRIERTQKNKRAIARVSDKLARAIPNPVLPWNILGDHTNRQYGKLNDSSIKNGTEGDPRRLPGGDPARGLYEGGEIDGQGGAVEQGNHGQGGCA